MGSEAQHRYRNSRLKRRAQQCLLSGLLQADILLEDACEKRTGLERTKAMTKCWGAEGWEMVKVGDKEVTRASASLYALDLRYSIT